MNQKFASISIVVACYNAEKYLTESLGSLSAQDYPEEFFEIICVDDGSTDGSAAIIRDFQAKHANIRYEYGPNGGLEVASNRGLRAAKKEWLVRIDADDWVKPDFLSVMNNAIQSHPKHDFFYCKEYVEYYSEASQQKKVFPDFDVEEIFCRGDFFAGGTVYQKKQLQEIGGYPEIQKNCALENYTVVLELISRGKKGLAVPGALFYYRRHDGNMTLRKEAIFKYGQTLLAKYGRSFSTNENHPYLNLNARRSS